MKIKEKSVSGPVNVVRLEGKVGNIDKVVYLFMDFHEPLNQQTECPDIEALDVDNFLVNKFKSLPKDSTTYDLFIEVDPIRQIDYAATPYKNIYIAEMVKLFYKAINVDPKTGKVYRSKELENVRLHYADIRQLTTDKLLKIRYGIENLLRNIGYHGQVYTNDVKTLYDSLKLLSAHTLSLYKLLSDTKNIKKPGKTNIILSKDIVLLSKYTDDDYQKIFDKLLYKLRYSYNHKEIQDTLNKIIQEDIHDTIENFSKEMDEILEIVDNLIKIVEPYKDLPLYMFLIKESDGIYDYSLGRIVMQIVDKLYTKLPDFLSKYLDGGFGRYIMDIYLLRRLLDKDYITNAIVYTGMGHSMNYIRLLVKYFDFKITHYSYLKDNNIEAVEKKIKISKDSEELNEYFFPPVLFQCSDLKNFPPDFK